MKKVLNGQLVDMSPEEITERQDAYAADTAARNAPPPPPTPKEIALVNMDKAVDFNTFKAAFMEWVNA